MKALAVVWVLVGNNGDRHPMAVFHDHYACVVAAADMDGGSKRLWCEGVPLLASSPIPGDRHCKRPHGVLVDDGNGQYCLYPGDL